MDALDLLPSIASDAEVEDSESDGDGQAPLVAPLARSSFKDLAPARRAAQVRRQGGACAMLSCDSRLRHRVISLLPALVPRAANSRAQVSLVIC